MASENMTTRLVDAAAETFLRYGYAKTTLGDIAKAAGISRPALYQHFSNKEELFAATVRHLNAERMADLRDRVERCSSLEASLAECCDGWLVQVFDLKLTTPDAVDMDDLSLDVVREVYAELVDYIATIIQNYAPVGGERAAAIASNIVFSVRGFSAFARDTQTMRSMMKLHVSLYCNAIESDVD